MHLVRHADLLVTVLSEEKNFKHILQLVNKKKYTGLCIFCILYYVDVYLSRPLKSDFFRDFKIQRRDDNENVA